MNQIDKSNLEKLTKNEGHSQVSDEMKKFASDPNIKQLMT